MLTQKCGSDEIDNCVFFKALAFAGYVSNGTKAKKLLD